MNVSVEWGSGVLNLITRSEIYS